MSFPIGQKILLSSALLILSERGTHQKMRSSALFLQENCAKSQDLTKNFRTFTKLNSVLQSVNKIDYFHHATQN